MHADTLIIIPSLNEQENLDGFLREILPLARALPADVLGINDASIDETARIFQDHGVPVLTHVMQMGYGTALQTGYKYALRHNYSFLVQIDGDGQHDPRFIPLLLERLRRDRVDVVIGSRFLKTDAFTPHRPLYRGTPLRLLGIRLFRALLALFCFRFISDPTSGYIAMNRRVFTYFSGNAFPFDYPDADVILTLLRNRFALREEGVYMYCNHRRGKLHRGCKPLWYVFKVTLSLLVSTLRPREL